MTLQR